MKKTQTFLLTAIISLLSVSTMAADFGDYSSATLAGKAWAESGQGNLDEALVYINKCIAMYEAEALKQQAGLSDFAPAASAHDNWALNDVGTCYFIKAQVLEKQGKKTESMAAYRTLAEKLTFSQCWDTKGWFWKPAEAAAAALKQADFDTLLDQ